MAHSCQDGLYEYLNVTQTRPRIDLHQMEELIAEEGEGRYRLEDSLAGDPAKFQAYCIELVVYWEYPLFSR